MIGATHVEQLGAGEELAAQLVAAVGGAGADQVVADDVADGVPGRLGQGRGDQAGSLSVAASLVRLVGLLPSAPIT